jgi:hypothetical protein
LSISAAAQVETFKIDPVHSAAHFAVGHIGIRDRSRGIYQGVRQRAIRSIRSRQDGHRCKR